MNPVRLLSDRIRRCSCTGINTAWARHLLFLQLLPGAPPPSAACPPGLPPPRDWPGCLERCVCSLFLSDWIRRWCCTWRGGLQLLDPDAPCPSAAVRLGCHLRGVASTLTLFERQPLVTFGPTGRPKFSSSAAETRSTREFQAPHFLLCVGWFCILLPPPGFCPPPYFDAAPPRAVRPYQCAPPAWLFSAFPAPRCV